MQGAEKKARSSAGKEAAGNDRFYKIGEVCAMTDTQPYVLRFWESEFPLLAPQKSRSGQRLYRKKDVDLVLTIKKLLYDEEYTIPGARKRLEEMGMGERPETAPAEPPARASRPARKGAAGAAKGRSRLDLLRTELLELRRMLDS